jgi:hypothetical protein
VEEVEGEEEAWRKRAGQATRAHICMSCIISDLVQLSVVIGWSFV